MPEQCGIVRQAISGDREAQRALVEQMWPDAFHLALSIVRDRQAAEDAAQEAAVALLRSIGKLRDPQAFRTWFYRIATRAALREQRRLRPEAGQPEPPSGDTEGRAEFRMALASLSPRDRSAIVLHYHYGFSSAEIGRIVGSPAGTVRYRLTMARRRLREALGVDRAGGAGNE